MDFIEGYQADFISGISYYNAALMTKRTPYLCKRLLNV